jgi:hypothetical protein
MAKKAAKQPVRYWSAAVTHGSNALDLEPGIFKLNDPWRIAWSLKHSAEHSRRRKGTPFQSAMSMLNFYVNRGGVGISARQKIILSRAKEALRQVFHKSPHSIRSQK